MNKRFDFSLPRSTLVNRVWVASLSMLLFFVTLPHIAFASNYTQVGNSASGTEIINGERSGQRKVGVWVGLDDNNEEKIVFQAGTIFGEATASFDNSKAIRKRLRQVVLKMNEWSDVARHNEVDTSKQLGCFAYITSCNSATDSGEISFRFISTNQGSRSVLLITIVDISNPIIRTSILFEKDEADELLSAISQIDAEFESIRKNLAKQKLFR